MLSNCITLSSQSRCEVGEGRLSRGEARGHILNPVNTSVVVGEVMESRYVLGCGGETDAKGETGP